MKHDENPNLAVEVIVIDKDAMVEAWKKEKGQKTAEKPQADPQRPK